MTDTFKPSNKQTNKATKQFKNYIGRQLPFSKKLFSRTIQPPSLLGLTVGLAVFFAPHMGFAFEKESAHSRLSALADIQKIQLDEQYNNGFSDLATEFPIEATEYLRKALDREGLSISIDEKNERKYQQNSNLVGVLSLHCATRNCGKIRTELRNQQTGQVVWRNNQKYNQFQWFQNTNWPNDEKLASRIFEALMDDYQASKEAFTKSPRINIQVEESNSL
ncbi:MAG: hypothetical protein AAGI66_03115 [Cyanobacteria bacterium P01_H01_bin.74]